MHLFTTMKSLWSPTSPSYLPIRLTVPQVVKRAAKQTANVAIHSWFISTELFSSFSDESIDNTTDWRNRCGCCDPWVLSSHYYIITAPQTQPSFSSQRRICKVLCGCDTVMERKSVHRQTFKHLPDYCVSPGPHLPWWHTHTVWSKPSVFLLSASHRQLPGDKLAINL